ncbi:phage tail assembly chaperone [Agrobacterium salinitolerans]|uniref:phage tail assembly chaperone n=1 Tax=Agrobacterium salinitolerans TaxID=1183413 RepID=UPI001572378B|nr:hypothetical protein [Agrobacterium salinitolerans]NTA36837.1 hypothetical protein [Agrobacterium salinitolerans]
MTVKVDRPLATVALRLQARLMKAAGGIADQLPAILGDLQQASTEEGKRQVGIKAIGLLTDVFDRLDDEEYIRLVGDIIGLAKIQRPSGHYEPADLDGDFSEMGICHASTGSICAGLRTKKTARTGQRTGPTQSACGTPWQNWTLTKSEKFGGCNIA